MSLGVAASSSAWLLQSGFRQVRNIADRNDDGLALEMAPAERIPLRLNTPGRYPSAAKAARMASARCGCRERRGAAPSAAPGSLQVVVLLRASEIGGVAAVRDQVGLSIEPRRRTTHAFSICAAPTRWQASCPDSFRRCR